MYFWEVIKAMQENPNMRARHIEWKPGEYFMYNSERIEIVDEENNPYRFIYFDDVYELVPDTVKVIVEVTDCLECPYSCHAPSSKLLYHISIGCYELGRDIYKDILESAPATPPQDCPFRRE
jgi:hypothetical protein